VGTADVLLTQGVTQALDLIVRTLLKPGDTVVVEDPCYCNLLQMLKLAGVNIVSVMRTMDGIDSAQLEAVVKEHRPKGIFINTVLQNPSGSSLNVASAFRVLQIADRTGMWVVEDDISRELAPPGAACLAAMEGLQRVIYVSGFSKTITPAARVGYIAANRELIAKLALTKMVVGLTSSEITERAVANVLIEGHYDKHVAQIRERLFNAHKRVTESMRRAGLEIFCEPNAGLFLWAKLPIKAEDSLTVTTEALEKGVWLAPGSYFRPDETLSPWFRFNAATSDVPELWKFVRGLGR
jgi:DNA-binding transcriptional MocR family regulator